MNASAPALASTSAPSPFSLSGKTVIQFGGTGNLGRALVSALASSGATLVVATRDAQSVRDAVALETKAGHAVTADEVDICSEPSLRALRDRVLAAHGRIDGIVFNAVARPMSAPGDALEKWETSMRVNATGFFATARVFCEAMAGAADGGGSNNGSGSGAPSDGDGTPSGGGGDNGSAPPPTSALQPFSPSALSPKALSPKGGSVVGIASMQGMVGPNFRLYEDPAAYPTPDYFFHKAGMINLARYFASLHGPRGVRVNTVSPGGILNPAKPPPAGFLSRYADMTLLGRMALAPEICGAVVFLLSDAASYITATNIPVDGGYTAK
ncbi:MAG: SDR family oxidoreductase [Opitutaceae bacterium]|nr:SDR family oxidoreductase [Opitutaceae bacterium]